MDCSRVREILQVGVDHEIDGFASAGSAPELAAEVDTAETQVSGLQSEFEQHLEDCSQCALQARGLQNLKALVRRSYERERATDGLRERVLALLDQEVMSSEAMSSEGAVSGSEGDHYEGDSDASEHSAPRVVEKPSASASNVTPITGRGSFFGRRLWSGLAAAGLIAIAVGYFLLPQELVHAEIA